MLTVPFLMPMATYLFRVESIFLGECFPFYLHPSVQTPACRISDRQSRIWPFFKVCQVQAAFPPRKDFRTHLYGQSRFFTAKIFCVQILNIHADSSFSLGKKTWAWNLKSVQAIDSEIWMLSKQQVSKASHQAFLQ